MTENNESVQASGLDSKFMKVALTIVSVLLMFGGAIYVPYLLSDIIHVDYVVSNVVGILLFIVGLGMIVFLIRKKVIE
jgi:xanthine/uracil permease